MHKFKFCFVLAGFLIAGFARAEIPLNLEATIVMSGIGDLQCWQSTSTYGYAYLNQRSIYYKFQLSDSLTSYEITNDTISNLWDIRLVRLGEGGENMGVVVLWHGPVHNIDSGYEHADYASILDLTERRVIQTVSVLWGYGNDFLCYYDDGAISSWGVWPPPPLQTEFLITGLALSSGTYCARMSGYEEYRDYINILHVADTVFWQTSSPGRVFSFFADTDTLRLVSSSRYELRCWGPEAPCYSSAQSLIRALVLGRAALNDYFLCQSSNENCPFTSVVAQQGFNGARRIITANGSAFDFETMDSLWGGAFSTADEFVSIRIDSTGDERILICNGAYCEVYDGMTGGHLGRTTAAYGDSAYVLKQPMRADRLVTRASYTYRIYRPANVSDQVDESANLIPNSFSLAQNYPNPFNPVTEIRFDLPEAAQVELSVFNVNGQWVRTLVKERLTPGVHTARFDGGNLPSGMYLYRLASPTFTQTRKMVLLK